MMTGELLNCMMGNVVFFVLGPRLGTMTPQSAAAVVLTIYFCIYYLFIHLFCHNNDSCDRLCFYY